MPHASRLAVLASAAAIATTAAPSSAATVPTLAAPVAEVELLVNGDFGESTLVGWTSIAPLGRADWATAATPVGAHALGPAEGERFATAMTAGSWRAGEAITLQQTIELPDDAVGYRASFDGWAGHDTLAVTIDWFRAGGPSMTKLRSDGLATLGGYGTVFGGTIDRFLAAPDDATHARFRAVGTAVHGTWVDAAIDNASLRAIVSVPEPATAGVLGIAGMAALRRRRA